MSTVTTRVHTASPMENGEVRCFWHPADPLPRRISHTSKNPDRAFYSCEVVSDGPTGATCKFFKWEDELQPVKSRPPSQGAVTSQSSPQTPSKRPASTPEHELSPQQKRLNSSQQTPTSSPQRAAASQTRLAAMLRAQGKLPAESEASSTLQSPSGAHQSVSPSASSSRPTATTQSSPLLPSWCSPKTSSTSFQPMTPPPTAEQTERHWPLQTPPSPSLRAPAAQSEDASRTRNENSNDPRNGIKLNSTLGASVDARLDDPFNCPTGSVTGSGGSEPRGPVASNHSLASADTEETSVADDYLDYSNRVAEYIRTLERRLEAAEKSNDAKAHRIEKMQEEMERLKNRNGELENTLAQLT